MTRPLRDDREPFWTRLRALFREKDVEPTTSVLAECFPDDNSFEFGVVVTADGGVFQFGFDYLHRSIAEGTLSEWVDLTERHASTPYRATVAEALRLLCQ